MSEQKTVDELIEEIDATINRYEITGNGRMRHVDMLKDIKAKLVEMKKALAPFAFFDPEDPDTTQEAWELRYQDRFKDWIDFEDIEAARAAIGIAGEEPSTDPEMKA